MSKATYIKVGGTNVTGKFLGTFFREPVRSHVVREISLGDIKVLEHCPNITEFYGSDTSITGEFLGTFLREPVP